MVELVIKMSEEDYNSIEPFLSGKYVCTVRFNLLEVLEIIKNGTPLPKGHGDLKDVSKFVYDCDCDGCDKICYCDNCVHHIVRERNIKEAPTIIEADKGE